MNKRIDPAHVEELQKFPELGDRVFLKSLDQWLSEHQLQRKRHMMTLHWVTALLSFKECPFIKKEL